MLLSVTVAATAWRYGAPLRLDLTQWLTTDARAVTQVAANERVGTTPAATDAALSTAAAGAVSADSLALAAPGAMDSITWTPAVARTWVNVRSDASRGGEVVGVIKPSSRAMLGTDRDGWRRVRSPDVNGWVDPRLFVSDSLASRGE